MPTTDDHDIWFPDRSTPARDATSTFATLAQSVDDAITGSAEDVIERLAPQVVPNLGALPEEALRGEKRWVSDANMEMTWNGSRWITSLPPNVFYAAKLAQSYNPSANETADIMSFTNVVEDYGGITAGNWGYQLPFPGRYRVDAHVRAQGINPTSVLVSSGLRVGWSTEHDFITPLTVTGSNSNRSGVMSEEVEMPEDIAAGSRWIYLRKVGAAVMTLTASSWIRIRYLGILS